MRKNIFRPFLRDVSLICSQKFSLMGILSHALVACSWGILITRNRPYLNSPLEKSKEVKFLHTMDMWRSLSSFLLQPLLICTISLLEENNSNVQPFILNFVLRTSDYFYYSLNLLSAIFQHLLYMKYPVWWSNSSWNLTTACQLSRMISCHALNTKLPLAYPRTAPLVNGLALCCLVKNSLYSLKSFFSMLSVALCFILILSNESLFCHFVQCCLNIHH